MPTGYTASVADGSMTDFNVFVMQCARNFGALIMMRDEPMNAPIPESFEPSGFYPKRLTEARQQLADLTANPSAMELQRRADAAHAAAVDAWEKRRTERAQSRERYTAMLAQVEAWTPPTTEHAELKSFMRQQLTESIRFDCSGEYDTKPVAQTVDDWFNAERTRLVRDITRYEEEVAKELERTASRNKWLADLRASLNSTPATV